MKFVIKVITKWCTNILLPNEWV